MAFVLAGVFLFGAQVTKVYSDYLESGDVLQPSLRAAASDSTADGLPSATHEPVPKAAIFGFLSGLFVAWRRNGK